MLRGGVNLTQGGSLLNFSDRDITHLHTDTTHSHTHIAHEQQLGSTSQIMRDVDHVGGDGYSTVDCNLSDEWTVDSDASSYADHTRLHTDLHGPTQPIIHSTLIISDPWQHNSIRLPLRTLTMADGLEADPDPLVESEEEYHLRTIHEREREEYYIRYVSERTRTQEHTPLTNTAHTENSLEGYKEVIPTGLQPLPTWSGLGWPQKAEIHARMVSMREWALMDDDMALRREILYNGRIGSFLWRPPSRIRAKQGPWSWHHQLHYTGPRRRLIPSTVVRGTSSNTTPSLFFFTFVSSIKYYK